MSRFHRRLSADRRGASMIEFALIVPVMLLLTIGAVDFARIFIQSQAVTSAANSGVVFGARRNVDSVNFQEMQDRALDDTHGAPGSTAAASMFCDCPSNPGVAVDCLSGSCPTYGKPRVYVRTTVTKQFETFGKYPGVPDSVDISRASFMRVQ